MKNRNRTMALICAAAAATGAVVADAATINVTADITTDTTWTSNNVYVLTKPIFVINGATLTIHAGTLIRGVQAAPPGALIITRGSKIRAMGTAERPIVMTGMNDNHFVGPTPVAGTAPWSTPHNGLTRLWGGLIVLGRGYIATNIGGAGTPSPHPSLALQIEGLQPYGIHGMYGGGNDDDDSGEIQYLSIRYGGFVLGADNEINGLTMGAVGRGSKFNHIEVFQNKDDAIEWFGSTLNMKYLIAWVDGDDGLDWDEGYRGKGQFWLRVQGPLASESDRSDKGAEMDGAMGDASQPSSIPTIYNATFVGLGRDSGLLSNTALHYRDGSGGRYYNSLFMDFAGAAALIEGAIGNPVFDSADHTVSNYVKTAFFTHDGGGRNLEVRNSYFWNFGFPNAFGCPPNTTQLATPYGASGTDGNLPHLDIGLFNPANEFNNTYDGGAAAPVAGFARSATVAVVIGGRTFRPLDFLDPTLPEGSPLLAAGVLPPADGFFTPVRMVGAFGSRNWAGWTLADRKGLMESLTYGLYADPSITASYVAATIEFPSVVGANYTVQFTPDEATVPWANLATGISGTGGVIRYTDQRPITQARVYRVLSSELAP